MTRRLLVVGVDGLPPALLRQLIAEERMPNFARLTEAGSLGVLRSTPNYQSASAWTSLVTGVNPGRHGVINFTNPVRGSYDFVQIDARARRAPTIWRILSDADVRVAALNIPVSYPAEQVEGVMVSGWLCPSPATEGFTYPAELAGWLADEVGDYPIHPDVRRHAAAGDYLTVARLARRGIRVKLEVARRIFERENPDVLCAVVTETDSLQHWCWHLLDSEHPEHDAGLAIRWREELLSVYSALDDALGQLLSAVGESADVLIVSDHGQAPNSGGQVLLRRWLVDRGYLVPQPRPSVQRLIDACTRVGFEAIRRHAGNRLKSRLRSRFPRLQRRAQRGMSGIAADWPRTRAWTEGGHVYVNTRGTWPEGCVDPDAERPGLLDELREGLLDLRDADSGERAVASVSLGSEQFEGRESDLMPDLLVHWRNDLRVTRLQDGCGAIIQRPGAPELPLGAHHPDGTLITCGPSFSPVEQPTPHSIYDVAPTLLHFFDRPVPEYFDGQVMTDLMTPEAREGVQCAAVNVPSVEHDPGSRVADDEIITRRLRSLGYVE
ncbi:MAG: alkaline phosphatase family protein [Armatimonadota bacterium]